ncbi:hypothetical protein VPH35_049772 [Triticum aestivum]|uniref:uncharacterized protein isoform X1 n=1 Tax=Triticum aestivum TaxID=4565 RepID=UPI000844C202|nr:uncharacterized protein LOC123064774 isoform X1 [Triticum aestivum]
MAVELQRVPMVGEIESEKEGFGSLDLCDRTAMYGRHGRSLEPVAAAKNLWKWVKAKLMKNKTYSLAPPSPPTSEDHISIRVSSDRGIPEVLARSDVRTSIHLCAAWWGVQLSKVATMASVLTKGFDVPRNDNSPNSGLQDGNNNEVTLNIDSESVEVPDDEPTSVPTILFPANLAVALWMMALLTLSMVIGTVLYKPARGGVFGNNKSIYYLTLASIFLFGVAEAFTAYCVSRSRDANKRRFSFGRVVLCASVGPFVAIVGIGGFTFIKG